MNTIIWDYNGTLLDDLKVCVETINDLLLYRRLDQITVSAYLETYDFPIISFFEKIGFDFEIESYDKVSREYRDIYNPRSNLISLRENAISVLDYFKKQNYRQVVLSAYNVELFKKQLKLYKIDEYFESIIGIDDFYAKTKIDEAAEWFEENKDRISKLTYIGDTAYDFKISEKLNCDCILISGGHNSKERLLKTEAKVIDSFEEIMV